MRTRHLSVLLPILVTIICSLPAAGKLTAPQLIELSRKSGSSQEFADALRASLADAEIKNGTAILGEGADFIWAVESEKEPVLYVDNQRMATLARAGSSNLWFYTGQLRSGTSHNFHYMVEGKRIGGRTDVAAYGPDSYSHRGVPEGRLSDKILHTSKIYDGMQTEYWIYVPAQYDPSVPAALMVWQDGQGLITRDGPSRLMNVVDNLIQQKKIPVMIQVLIAPGKIGDKAMRSIEYDTVSDRYARFLRDEILADVQSKYNIRRDGYSRGIAGNSSGGICSFNVAWHQPDQFSRVLSRIGSFTSIQWKTGQPDAVDGGNDYPFKIRKESKRNIRVWLQDGSEDLENAHGSWPLQNIQMANSLKMKEYDFHFSFGSGTHNGAHGNAELPEELIWLWRDYDPARTEQQYAMDPAEKEKPYYRVKIYNRE